MPMIAVTIDIWCGTLCFSPWREEGLGEAPAGEQGAEESVQGESEGNQNVKIEIC